MASYATRDTLRFVVIGLAAIAAISMGAATIQSTRDVGPEGGSIQESPSGSGLEMNNNTSMPSGNGTSLSGEGSGGGATIGNITQCVDFLASGIGGLLYFGAFGGVIYLIKRRYSFGTALLSIYGIIPVALVGYFLNTACNTGGATGDSGGSGVQQALNNSATTGVIPTNVSPVVLAGVLGALLLGAGVVLFRASGDQMVEMEEEEEEEGEEGPDVADLAAAAGAAADRLAEHDADVDNEVYRAWYEMTSLLDVPNPESSTPGEFADAAVEVGMNREDVDELTTLFNEVRYGKRDPESREELALDVFRRIESEYGATETDNPATNGGEN